MTFLRDMDKESGEYMAAVDQALVHCRDSNYGIRDAGEVLQSKMHDSSTEPIDPAIAAAATFPHFIKGLEKEAGIKIDFVVEPHTLSIHKLYVRFVKESALLYTIVAAAKMALVSSKEEAPFSANDMFDELLRSYHKKTEAMALVLAQEVLLHGQATDPDDSELEYLSAQSSQEEDEEDEEGEEEGQEGEEEEDDGLSDNEEAIMDLAHARAELGLDKEEGQERDELADELKGLMMDAADLHDGLEELKHIEDQMRASGGSMALPPPIKEEPKEEPKEASPSSSSSAGSSASEGKRKRVE